jgi:FtsZ-binding cell division protein ZapB
MTIDEIAKRAAEKIDDMPVLITAYYDGVTEEVARDRIAEALKPFLEEAKRLDRPVAPVEGPITDGDALRAAVNSVAPVELPPDFGKVPEPESSPFFGDGPIDPDKVLPDDLPVAPVELETVPEPGTPVEESDYPESCHSTPPAEPKGKSTGDMIHDIIGVCNNAAGLSYGELYQRLAHVLVRYKPVPDSADKTAERTLNNLAKVLSEPNPNEPPKELDADQQKFLDRAMKIVHENIPQTAEDVAQAVYDALGAEEIPMIVLKRAASLITAYGDERVREKDNLLKYADVRVKAQSLQIAQQAEDNAALSDENAALRARVEELEKDNVMLKARSKVLGRKIRKVRGVVHLKTVESDIEQAVKNVKSPSPVRRKERRIIAGTYKETIDRLIANLREGKG